ncbi:prepilin-type N-terminal cleavage/methylation domain-containing protein [Andreesenia angusta]|nr:prepilin-type N-terminal cleavage/methylation domain-containing protein [Andreesenia angusta]
MKKRISNNKGLTLIELIIVIAIIGILAVIGVTQFGGMTESARKEADKAVLAEVENAAKLYIATEEDALASGEVSSDHALVKDGYLESAPEIQAEANGGPDNTVTITVTDNDVTAAATGVVEGDGEGE